MNHNIPEEFSEIPPYGPYGELTGPIYGCVREGIPIVAMQMEKKHANRSGDMVHGGLISTLADNALVWGLRQLHPKMNPFVTTQLSVDLMGPVSVGSRLEARVNFVKSGRSISFAQCYIYVDDRVVAKASGQFVVLSK